MTSLLVVVPTRNRADLAWRAVRSAATGEGDVAVVLSDNSTEPADVERMARFCRDWDGPGVSYIRPPQSMSMVDHWNWALREAFERHPATHVTFLSDRMVFRPHALRDLLGVASRHPDDVVTFNFDSVDDRSKPVRLIQHLWSGEEIPIPSQRLLDLAAEGDVLHRPTPRMLNCAVPISVLEDLRRRFGDVFASLAPDYCFAYRCLSVVDAILYYDRPCIIEYGISRSHGTNVMLGRRTPERADFLSLAGPRGLYFAAPIPGLDTALNAVFHEYCFVRSEERGKRLKPLRTEPYLARLASEVAGFEDPDLRADALRVLRDNGWRGPVHAASSGLGLRRQLARLGENPRDIARRATRLCLSRVLGHPLTKPLWLRLADRGVAPPVDQRFQFATVDEALAYAYRFPRPSSADLSHLGPLSPPGGALSPKSSVNDRTTDGRSSSTAAGR